MRIIDHGVAPEVEQGVVEVRQRLLEVPEQEIRDSLLKVCNGEILV